MSSGNQLFLLFIFLFHAVANKGQSEKAFEFPLPKRLIVIDSILGLPDLTRADTATLTKKNQEPKRIVYTIP